MSQLKQCRQRLMELVSAPLENFEKTQAQVIAELKPLAPADRAELNGNELFSQLYRVDTLGDQQKLSLAKIFTQYGIKQKKPYEGIFCSGLYYAIKRGDAESADYLLRHKADPHEIVPCEPFYNDEGVPEDQVPLVTFSEVCRGTETTRLLLKHGADVNARASDGRSIVPYVFKAVLQGWDFDQLKARTALLCKHGYRLSQREGPGTATVNDHILFYISNKFCRHFEHYYNGMKQWEKFARPLLAKEQGGATKTAAARTGRGE